jgi:SAM-dependent methyltransferase
MSANISPLATTLTSRMHALHPLSSATGILDIGCGAGTLTRQILDTQAHLLPPTATLTAADYSAAMVSAVQSLRTTRLATLSPDTPQHEAWTRLSIQQLDAHDTSTHIPDASQSHIVAGHVYFLLQNPRLALLDAHRALSKTGIIALSVGQRAAHIDALTTALSQVNPTAEPFRVFNPPWDTEAGVKAELEASGFVEVETFEVEMEMGFEDPEEFARTLLMMPVAKNAVQGWEEEEKESLVGVFAKELVARGGEERKLAGASIVALARKR